MPQFGSPLVLPPPPLLPLRPCAPACHTCCPAAPLLPCRSAFWCILRYTTTCHWDTHMPYTPHTALPCTHAPGLDCCTHTHPHRIQFLPRQPPTAWFTYSSSVPVHSFCPGGWDCCGFCPLTTACLPSHGAGLPACRPLRLPPLCLCASGCCDLWDTFHTALPCGGAHTHCHRHIPPVRFRPAVTVAGYRNYHHMGSGASPTQGPLPCPVPTTLPFPCTGLPASVRISVWIKPSTTPDAGSAPLWLLGFCSGAHPTPLLGTYRRWTDHHRPPSPWIAFWISQNHMPYLREVLQIARFCGPFGAYYRLQWVPSNLHPPHGYSSPPNRVGCHCVPTTPGPMPRPTTHGPHCPSPGAFCLRPIPQPHTGLLLPTTCLYHTAVCAHHTVHTPTHIPTHPTLPLPAHTPRPCTPHMDYLPQFPTDVPPVPSPPYTASLTTCPPLPRLDRVDWEHSCHGACGLCDWEEVSPTPPTLTPPHSTWHLPPHTLCTPTSTLLRHLLHHTFAPLGLGLPVSRFCCLYTLLPTCLCLLTALHTVDSARFAWVTLFCLYPSPIPVHALHLIVPTFFPCVLHCSVLATGPGLATHGCHHPGRPLPQPRTGGGAATTTTTPPAT